MTLDVDREVAELQAMTVSQLRERYGAVFGEEPRSRNKTHLWRRIIWRLQANEEGGLSERAKLRATELADEAELRLTAPKGQSEGAKVAGSTGEAAAIPVPHDWRLPMPGSTLRREYRGKTYVVKILDKGFELNGRAYRSLSGVAKAITGTHINGFAFFGLDRTRRAR
jgi:hypothetical protein